MSVGLNIALTAAESALKTSQEQLSIISNNISESNNSSYHKQSTIVTNSVLVPGDAGYYGTGSYVSSIVRSYSSALETSLRNASSDAGYTETYYEQLSQIEELVGPNAESNLNDMMSEFATAVDDVSNNAEDITYRESLLASADALTNSFNTQYESLTTLRDYIAENDTSGSGALNDSCIEVNTILDSIAELNDRIALYESDIFISEQANALRDERDALCLDLSEYLEINIAEESDGKYTITLNDGSLLVDGTLNSSGGAASSLTVTMVDPTSSGFYTPTLTLTTASGSSTIDLTGESGKLQGYIDARSYITNEMTELYDYALSFANAVNAIQNATGAYDLYGNDNAGDLFTVPSTQPTSGELINVAISNPKAIAASSDAAQAGNGEIYEALYDKLNEDNTIDGTDSYLNHAARLLSSLSIDVASAQSDSDTATSMVALFENKIQAVSGVDTDEELANMLDVQRVYAAAAKIISIVDEMLKTILGMV